MTLPHFKRLARASSLALCLLASTFGAQAAWPERSVTVVVPFPAGGPIDQLARQLASHLQDTTGKPVVVDNRSGAGGVLGTQQVLRAAPDGHTLLLATVSSQITVPQAMPRPPDDGASDFTPIAAMVSYPFLLVAKPQGPDSVRGLVAAGRRTELSYGSFGIGSGNHLVASYFAQSTGMRAINVPYRGSGATSQALMGGEIDFVFDSVQAVMGMVTAGKMKALAVSSRSRSPGLPDIPTLQESGLPGFDEVIWVGLVGPKGMPQEAVQRINAEVNRFLEQTEFRARLQLQGATVLGGTSREFGARMKADQQRWSRFIATHNIRIE